MNRETPHNHCSTLRQALNPLEAKCFLLANKRSIILYNLLQVHLFIYFYIFTQSFKKKKITINFWNIYFKTKILYTKILYIYMYLNLHHTHKFFVWLSSDCLV